MQPAPLNFANHGQPNAPHRTRTNLRLLSWCLILALLVMGVTYIAVGSATILKITNRPLLAQLTHLITSKNQGLKGENQDRVNILLLGIGGPGHEGAYLTDTMIVLSIKPSTKQLAMLSIPRDLAVSIPRNGVRKINAANALGRDMSYPGGGEALSAAIVSQVIGQPIQYYARVDFAGFTKLINDVGGVQVTVDRTFTDYEYPTLNYGYQTIGFKSGPQRMNGDLALKYTRSRHGNNGEGSDFARARRQQKVLAALKDKLFSLSLLTSPKRMSSVLQTFGDHTRTNMEIWEMLRTVQIARGNTGSIANVVLDSSPLGLLRNETGLDGAFLLVPRTGDYTAIHALASNIFTLDSIKGEGATVAVDSSRATSQTLAALTDQLGLYAATVVRLTTSTALGNGQTVVYDLSNGNKPFTKEALASQFQVLPGETTTLPPAVTTQLTNQSADFIIVLGKSQTASRTPVPTPPHAS